MTWQVSLALQGNLQKFLDGEVKAGRKAVFGVINRRKNNLKNNLRRQVVKNFNKGKKGGGQRLANTIRDWINPEKEFAKEITAYVFSKALYKRPGGVVDLITLYDTGGIQIGSRGKKYNAIANPAVVGTGGGGTRGHPIQKSPSDPEFKGLLFFRTTSRANLAILSLKSDPDKVAFWLVKVARYRKRIDINRAYNRSIRNIEEAVATTWERESRKNSIKFDVDK